MSRTANTHNEDATKATEEIRPSEAEASRPRFSTRLYDLRTIRQETQRQVAADVGVATPTYSSWERGERELKAEHIKALARHFRVSPNEILDYGEVAEEIPRLDSDLERFIKLWRRAEPSSRQLAEGALQLGAKARRPH